jgi:hypothetical protein
MANETGDAQVGTQTDEPTHPAIRLLGDPVGSDQRLKAVARHDKLTREHPVGASVGGHPRAVLDQRTVAV